MAVIGARRRASLTVTVDLAETGELSTVNHWRLLLQERLDEMAGHFHPVVRGGVSRLNSSQQTDQNRPA